MWWMWMGEYYSCGGMDMKLTIFAPGNQMEAYLEQVLKEVKEGYTSGHVDSDSNWELEEEANKEDVLVLVEDEDGEVEEAESVSRRELMLE
jgi:hypothetical protein